MGAYRKLRSCGISAFHSPTPRRVPDTKIRICTPASWFPPCPFARASRKGTRETCHGKTFLCRSSANTKQAGTLWAGGSGYQQMTGRRAGEGGGGGRITYDSKAAYHSAVSCAYAKTRSGFLDFDFVRRLATTVGIDGQGGNSHDTVLPVSVIMLASFLRCGPWGTINSGSPYRGTHLPSACGYRTEGA